MSTLLVRNARVLVTMDETRREIARGGMFIRGGFIEQVGDTKNLPQIADEIFDLSGHIVLPGFVNTHHHLNQTLDRAYPSSQNGNLVQWLKMLYPRWEKFKPEDTAVATELGLVEIALSGCTTVADHQYLWPKGVTAGGQFEIASKIGVRFHLGRGSQNVGQAQGGFAPASLVEDDDDILASTAEIVTKFHNPSPGSFNQVFVAPSSLRTATTGLLQKSAEFAAKRNLRFHFHLGETKPEIDFVRDKYGKRPAQLADELGCLTPRSWVAHGVHFDDDDISALLRCGCGICHCPSSNMRLSSGIAPVRRYLNRGLAVGLGVDGSASNDASNLMQEVRAAFLLQRSRYGVLKVSHKDALRWATTGSAACVGRTDIGEIAVGKMADLALFKLDELRFSGSGDPLAALVLCGAHRADRVMVGGRWVVENGQIPGLDAAGLIRRHSAAARTLQAGN